jgi:mannose-6-phosphate isomerase-like protein (cupin superfamily)
MELININDITDFDKTKIKKCIPVMTDQLVTTTLFIESNVKMPALVHDGRDEILYIMKGAGKISIEDSTEDIEEGMIILVPKGKKHYFTTNGEKLIVLSVRSTK